MKRAKSEEIKRLQLFFLIVGFIFVGTVLIPSISLSSYQYEGLRRIRQTSSFIHPDIWKVSQDLSEQAKSFKDDAYEKLITEWNGREDWTKFYVHKILQTQGISENLRDALEELLSEINKDPEAWYERKAHQDKFKLIEDIARDKLTDSEKLILYRVLFPGYRRWQWETDLAEKKPANLTTVGKFVEFLKDNNLSSQVLNSRIYGLWE